MATDVATSPAAGGTTTFTCKNCGATTNFAAAGKSIRCPFCGSEYVIARTDDPNTPRPEALIAFTVPDTQVQGIYRSWLGEGFFRPRDLTQLATNHQMRAVYLPLWECQGHAISEWTATAGYEHDREETYQDSEGGKSVTKTRTVTETDWRPAEGHHEATYPRELVSGSKGLPQDWVQKLGDFNFGELHRYDPQFLLGRETEESVVDRTAALEIARRQIVTQEEAACARLVPGDTHKDLRVQTQVTDLGGRLLSLPVWLASFQYKGKVYRCVVNGQTGQIDGEAPVSGTRIALVIGVVVVVIVVILVLVKLF